MCYVEEEEERGIGSSRQVCSLSIEKSVNKGIDYEYVGFICRRVDGVLCYLVDLCFLILELSLLSIFFMFLYKQTEEV